MKERLRLVDSPASDSYASRMPLVPKLHLVTAIALVFAGGCSSNGGGGSPADPAKGDAAPGADTGSAATDSGSIEDGATPADCSEDPADRPAGSVCVRLASGVLQEMSGAPLANTVVSLCGGVCFFAKTDATGKWTAHPGRYIKVARFAAQVHGRPNHASTFEKIPMPDASDNITMAAPILVPTYDGIGPELPADGAAATTVVAGDVSLALAAGASFDLDVEDVASKTGRVFKSAKWTGRDLPAFAKDSGALALYALAPFNVVSCKTTPCSGTDNLKMGVTLPNTTGLAAGADVELLTMSTDVLANPPTAGVLQLAATGKVSADGKTIGTADGEGISRLTWLAVRAKR